MGAEAIMRHYHAALFILCGEARPKYTGPRDNDCNVHAQVPALHLAVRLGAAPEVLELLIEVHLAMGGEVIFTQPCILKCTRWCIDDFTVHD